MANFNSSRLGNGISRRRPFLQQFWIPIVISALTFGLTKAINLGTASEVALTFLAFLAPVLIQIQISLSNIELYHTKMADTRLLHIKGNKSLDVIVNSYNTIASGTEYDGGLFLRFFERKLSELSSYINDAASTGELKINSNHHYMTDTVLSVFDEDEITEFKETYLITDQNRIFDPHSMNYLIKVIDRLRNGSLKSVKSLFIIPSTQIERGSELETLLMLHQIEPGLNFRLISANLYEEIRRDMNLLPEFIDFGLYGPGLMFRTITYDPSTAGSFSRHRATITSFHELFDACWNSPAATQTSYDVTVKSDLLLNRLIHLGEQDQQALPAPCVPSASIGDATQDG